MPFGSHEDGCLGDVNPKGLTFLASPLQSGLNACQIHPFPTTGIQDAHLLCTQAIYDV